MWVLKRQESLADAGLEEVILVGRACYVAGTHSWFLGVKSQFNSRPEHTAQSYNQKEVNSANNPNELGRGPGASDKVAALVDLDFRF